MSVSRLLVVDRDDAQYPPRGDRVAGEAAADHGGIQPRPLAETYRDTIRWLHHTGQLTARQAGDTTSAGR